MAVIALFCTMMSATFWQQQMRVVVDVQSRVLVLYVRVVSPPPPPPPPHTPPATPSTDDAQFLSNMVAMYNLFTAAPRATGLRAVVYRERATGMYSLPVFVLSDAVAELLYSGLEVLVAIGITYFAVGLNPDVDALAYTALLIYVLVVAHTYLGILFSWLMPDAQSAQIASITIVQVAQIFSGITVPYQNLPRPFRPFYAASIIKYSMEGLVAVQFHEDPSPVICVPYGEVPPPDSIPGRLHLCTSDGSGAFRKVVGLVTTASEFVSTEFLPDYDYGNRFLDLGVIAAVAVLLKVVQWVAMLTVNHNLR